MSQKKHSGPVSSRAPAVGMHRDAAGPGQATASNAALVDQLGLGAEASSGLDPATERDTVMAAMPDAIDVYTACWSAPPSKVTGGAVVGPAIQPVASGSSALLSSLVSDLDPQRAIELAAAIGEAMDLWTASVRIGSVFATLRPGAVEQGIPASGPLLVSELGALSAMLTGNLLPLFDDPQDALALSEELTSAFTRWVSTLFVSATAMGEGRSMGEGTLLPTLVVGGPAFGVA